MKSAPFFIFLASIFPAKVFSIISFAINKPIPVPSSFEVLYALNNVFIFLIPPALSSISIITSAGVFDVLIFISGFSIFFSSSFALDNIINNT